MDRALDQIAGRGTSTGMQCLQQVLQERYLRCQVECLKKIIDGDRVHTETTVYLLHEDQVRTEITVCRHRAVDMDQEGEVATLHVEYIRPEVGIAPEAHPKITEEEEVLLPEEGEAIHHQDRWLLRWEVP